MGVSRRWFVFRGLMALSLAAGWTVAVPADAGLTKDNFVDAADALVDLLDTSGIAFATFMLGQAEGGGARRAVFQALPGNARREPFEAPCPGGGVVAGAIVDTDGDGVLSPGDRFSTSFRACRVDPASDVVSGSSEFVVKAHRIDGPVETTELHFRFQSFGTDSLRWSGPADVVLRSDVRNGTEHYVIDYRNLSVRHRARECRWNYRIEVRRPPLGEQTARIDGAVTIGAVALTLVQDEPFVLARNGTPRAGRLTATDADGDRLLVEASRRRYRYLFFSRGNRGDLPDSTSQSRTWP
jgi:hypothetical protein